jgi:hypothetical protein
MLHCNIYTKPVYILKNEYLIENDALQYWYALVIW